MKISITKSYRVNVTREYDISPEALAEIDESIESLWEDAFDDDSIFQGLIDNGIAWMPDPSEWTTEQLQDVAESYGEYEQVEEDWDNGEIVEVKLNV